MEYKFLRKLYDILAEVVNLTGSIKKSWNRIREWSHQIVSFVKQKLTKLGNR